MVRAKKTIYLDQNFLTELRVNKLYTSDPKLIQLLKLLTSNKYTIAYSRVTLLEIYNIDNKIYIDEHLETLRLLNAIYWDRLFTPNEHNVYVIYKNFVKVYEGKFSKNLHASNEKFIKRLNGIDIGITTKDSFNSMLSEAVSIPFSYLGDKIPILRKANKYFSKKAVDFTINYFSKISNELPDFDPVNFRDYINMDAGVESIVA